MKAKRVIEALVLGTFLLSGGLAAAQTASAASAVIDSAATKPAAGETQPSVQALQQKAALINRLIEKFQADAAAQGGPSFDAIAWRRDFGSRLVYQSVESLAAALTAPSLAVAQNELFNATRGATLKHSTDNHWTINFLATPCRIVDTRSGGGGALGPAWRNWTASTGTASIIAGQGGNAGGCGNFPNADGFLLYVTVVPTSQGGPDFLTVQHTASPTPPSTSTMNYYGQNIANFAITSCQGCGGSDGSFYAYASRSTNVVIDLLAWTGTVGPVALDCTTATSTASFLGTVVASCPVGYALTGGGCKSSSITDHTYQTFPSSATDWGCGFWPESGSSLGATLTAYAQCCRVPGL